MRLLQTHRETDRFFAASGVQSAQSTSDHFHFRHTAFSSQLKSKVGNILDEVEVLRITLNIDGASISSKSHTHPSHSQTSRLLTSSLSLGVPIFRCSSPSFNPVYAKRVNPSVLVFRLSSHRHSYVGLLFMSRFSS